MKVNVESDGMVTRLSIAGDMTIYSAGELKPALLSAIQGTRTIEVNLAEVTDLDTAGFQLLLLAKREAARDRKSFLVREPSSAVRSTLDMYRMTADLLDPADDPNAEVAAPPPSKKRRGT